jgi:predicted phage replisome organizer
MAEVKWIKIVTDVFDDEKTLMIETLPDADSIIVIWFKLLCLAGKQNNSGVFLMGRMPYTDEMFATVFRRPLNTVRLALKTFEDFGMIEIINDTVTIPNWEKHQSIDKLVEIREQNRLRVAKHREKQKSLTCNVTSNVTVTQCNALDKSRKEKKREEKTRQDVEVEVDGDSSKSPATTATEEDTLKVVGGSLGKGVVYLTDRQLGDLMDRLGLDAFNRYVDRLATWIIDNNAHVKSHYDTILKWYEEDSKVSNKKTNKNKTRYGDFDADEALAAALKRPFPGMEDQ